MQKPNGKGANPKVAIVIPGMSDIKSDMGMHLCSMASYSLVQGVQVVLISERCSYVTYARNKLVVGALRHHVDYLM